MKGKFLQFACGVLAGAALFGGASTVAAGIVAEPSWSPIYVDGQQAQMTAYNIGGNNYVKLRDIGKAVGFNVYFLDGVQVDSKAPYTGEAPAQAGAQRPTAASADSVRVNCYKDGSLSVGEDTALMIYPSGVEYTVVSDHPAVAVVEQVKGFWKVNALSPGEATITATAPDGRSGRVTQDFLCAVRRMHHYHLAQYRCPWTNPDHQEICRLQFHQRPPRRDASGRSGV